MSQVCRFALFAVVSLALAAPAAAQEWTRFRGPNGTGLSNATTVPTTWTEKDYNWVAQLPGEGHSSPVIWGGKIFLTSANEESAERFVLCLDQASGKILWSKKYVSEKHHKHVHNTFASATPAVDESQVYVTWSTPQEYTLLALDHQGNEVWSRDLGPFVSQHSCGTSPIVYEDLVVLGNEQDGEKTAKQDGKEAGKSFLIAVDRKTGQTRWQIDRESDVVAYSTPCVYQPEGGKPQLIFNSSAHGISSIDPASGKINWEIGGLLDKRSCSSSLMADGLFIASCGSGGGGNYLVAVHPGDTGKSDAGQLAYRVEKAAPYVPTPIAKGEYLFLWNDKGMAACLKATTGEYLWEKRVGGNFFGSPICVGDRLFNIDVDGNVVVLAASDNYNLLAKNPLGEKSHSTPAVANGTLYLRTVSHLYSVGGKQGAE
jgi:outer membrane protein assembly factor BamB